MTLIGPTPPEGSTSASFTLPRRSTRSRESVLLPALTAKSRSPSRTMAPCEPSPAPVPFPPVATVPAGVSEPSFARSKTATALPDAAFVSV